MTKYEKAVLRACEERFIRLMKDDGIAHPLQAIERNRRKRGVGMNLIRATARWMASKSEWQR